MEKGRCMCAGLFLLRYDVLCDETARVSPCKFYRPREPDTSPSLSWLPPGLTKFERVYPERFQKQFGFWREGQHEIDLVVSGGKGPLMAFECKSGPDAGPSPSIRAFRQRFSAVPLSVVSASDSTPRKVGDLDVLPWQRALDRYLAL
jgi:hypothetical protein